MQTILIGFIKIYQKTLSLFIGGECRFYPTCSNYSIEAIRKHGSFKGSWLTIKRISRCHPLNPGGVDEVPEPFCQCQHKH
ncbi:membrane protein insertion efficiency factor YidD [Aliikangiella coralliicola]|nr:membrane protein insertion efficiency factor YidD [Aliikangiella coralliicola]